MLVEERLQSLDSVFLVRNGISYAKSGAVIRCLLYMGWHWRVLFPLAWLIPSPIRDIMYDLVAKRRHTLK